MAGRPLQCHPSLCPAQLRLLGAMPLRPRLGSSPHATAYMGLRPKPTTRRVRPLSATDEAASRSCICACSQGTQKSKDKDHAPVGCVASSKAARSSGGRSFGLGPPASSSAESQFVDGRLISEPESSRSSLSWSAPRKTQVSTAG